MVEDRNNDDAIADALRFVLVGVSHGDDIHALIREFGPLGRFADSGAGESVFDLAADALELGGFTRNDPLNYVTLRERFLPEVGVSGRHENYKSDWTLRAAAALAAGVDPGFEDQLRFWQVLDLERWAIHALVVYGRASADHAGVTLEEICASIADRRGIDLST